MQIMLTMEGWWWIHHSRRSCSLQELVVVATGCCSYYYCWAAVDLLLRWSWLLMLPGCNLWLFSLTSNRFQIWEHLLRDFKWGSLDGWPTECCREMSSDNFQRIHCRSQRYSSDVIQRFHPLGPACNSTQPSQLEPKTLMNNAVNEQLVAHNIQAYHLPSSSS